MMKGPDIGYLRYAAKNSVCSIKPGYVLSESCYLDISKVLRFK